MKAAFKLLLGLVAACVGLVVLAALALTLFFDPNAYKPQIQTLAREQAAVELDINGDIGWSVFPWLGLSLEDVDVKFVGSAPLASLDEARVSVNIPALFSGQVQMQSVEVHGLAINLVQQSATENNWTPPSTNSAETTTTTETAADETSGTGNGSDGSTSEGLPLAINIEKVALVDANIAYEDRVSQMRALVSALNLETGEIALNALTDVSLSMVLKQFEGGATTPAIEAPLSLTTQLGYADATQVLTLNDLLLKVSATGSLTQNQTYSLEVGSDIQVDLANQSLSLKALLIKLANLVVSGEATVNNFADPQVAATLNIAEFALNPLLESIGQAAIETSDPDVLKKIGLSAQINATSQQVKVSDLALKLDDTLFKGTAGYGIESGRISARIAGDAINADRYLPPASEAAEPVAAAPASSEPYSKDELIPLEPLQGLNLDVAFDLGQLIIQKMTVSDIVLAVTANKGQVNLQNLTAKAFDGTLAAKAQVNATKAPLKMALQTQLNGLQVGQALEAVADTKVLTGTAATQANLTLQGQSIYDWVHSVSGTASASFSDGYIQGIDMLHTVCKGINTVSSLGINPDPVDPMTPFANVSLSTKIVNGVVQNNDLKALLDAMTLSGKGSIDLPQQGLDYRVALVLEKDLLNESCGVADFIEGVEWPVVCKGNFDTPPLSLCKPDMSGFKAQFQAKADAAKAKLEAKAKAAEAEAKAKLEAQKAKAKAEADAKLAEEKAKLEDKAKDALKGLFGR